MPQPSSLTNGKKKKNPENRPIRVYAAILMLVILIAGILYFNRNSVPQEIKDAVSSGNKDSVWTFYPNIPVAMELKTPEGNTFRLTKTPDDRVAYAVNGKPVATQKDLEKYKTEFDLLMLELQKRDTAK